MSQVKAGAAQADFGTSRVTKELELSVSKDQVPGPGEYIEKHIQFGNDSRGGTILKEKRTKKEKATVVGPGYYRGHDDWAPGFGYETNYYQPHPEFTTHEEDGYDEEGQMEYDILNSEEAFSPEQMTISQRFTQSKSKMNEARFHAQNQQAEDEYEIEEYEEGEDFVHHSIPEVIYEKPQKQRKLRSARIQTQQKSMDQKKTKNIVDSRRTTYKTYLNQEESKESSEILKTPDARRANKSSYMISDSARSSGGLGTQVESSTSITKKYKVPRVAMMTTASTKHREAARVSTNTMNSRNSNLTKGHVSEEWTTQSKVTPVRAAKQASTTTNTVTKSGGVTTYHTKTTYKTTVGKAIRQTFSKKVKGTTTPSGGNTIETTTTTEPTTTKTTKFKAFNLSSGGSRSGNRTVTENNTISGGNRTMTGNRTITGTKTTGL